MGNEVFENDVHHLLMTRLYEKLVAWQEAYKLSLEVYSLTRKFPNEERFGLTSQTRNAATSVPINIAEGNTKRSEKDRARFFEIALASLNELHCECLLAKDLKYISQEDFTKTDEHIQRVSFLITRLIGSLR